MAGTFPEELLFDNMNFSDELLFHATLLFHSYTYLSVTNYVYENSALVTYSLSVGVLFFCIYYCSKLYHRQRLFN